MARSGSLRLPSRLADTGSSGFCASMIGMTGSVIRAGCWLVSCYWGIIICCCGICIYYCCPIIILLPIIYCWDGIIGCYYCCCIAWACIKLACIIYAGYCCICGLCITLGDCIIIPLLSPFNGIVKKLPCPPIAAYVPAKVWDLGCGLMSPMLPDSCCGISPSGSFTLIYRFFYTG